MANLFSNISDTVTSTIESAVNNPLQTAMLLADPGNEDSLMDSDRISEEVGVNVQLATQAAQPKTVVPTTVSSTSDTTNVSESSLSLTNLSTKFYIISNTKISSTETLFRTSYKLSYPKDFFGTDSAITTAMEYMTLYRFGIEVKIQINPNQFNQGGLVAYYAPRHFLTEDNNIFFAEDVSKNLTNPWTIFNLPHTHLDYTETSEGTFVIPYNNHALMYDDDEGVFGEFGIMPWSPLRGSDGASLSLNVQIFARLINPEFFVLGRRRNPFTDQQQSEIFSKINRLIFSRGNKDEITALIEELKFLQEIPQTESEKLTNISRTVFNTSESSHGPTPIHSLGFDNDSNGDQSDVCSSEEVTYARALATPSLFHTLSWDTGTSSGEKLFDFNITPTLYSYQATNTRYNPVAVNVKPTNVAAVALNFSQWSGDLNFRFKIYATRFHKGRLLFLFTPNVSTPPSNIYDDRSTYMWQLDLGPNSNEIEFTIPFISPTKRKRVQNPSQFAAQYVKSFPDHSIIPKIAALEPHLYSTGNLSVWVQNPLVSSSTVEPRVDLYSYISGGENLKFYWPDHSWAVRNNGRGKKSYASTEGLVTQSAAAPTELPDPSTQENSSPSFTDDLSSNNHTEMSKLLSRPLFLDPIGFDPKLLPDPPYRIYEVNPLELPTFKIINPFSSFFAGPVYVAIYAAQSDEKNRIEYITNLSNSTSNYVDDKDHGFCIYRFGVTDNNDYFFSTSSTYIWNRDQEQVAVFKLPYGNFQSLARYIMGYFEIRGVYPLPKDPVFVFFGPESKFYFLNACSNYYFVYDIHKDGPIHKHKHKTYSRTNITNEKTDGYTSELDSD